MNLGYHINLVQTIYELDSYSKEEKYETMRSIYTEYNSDFIDFKSNITEKFKKEFIQVRRLFNDLDDKYLCEGDILFLNNIDKKLLYFFNNNLYTLIIESILINWKNSNMCRINIKSNVWSEFYGFKTVNCFGDKYERALNNDCMNDFINRFLEWSKYNFCFKFINVSIINNDIIIEFRKHYEFDLKAKFREVLYKQEERKVCKWILETFYGKQKSYFNN